MRSYKVFFRDGSEQVSISAYDVDLILTDSADHVEQKPIDYNFFTEETDKIASISIARVPFELVKYITS